MTTENRKQRNRARELTRHQSFVTDGLELFEVLLHAPGVTKIKAGEMSGRRAKIRVMTLNVRGSSLRCTIGTNDGHQVFWVYGAGVSAATVREVLSVRFPGYRVQMAN